MYWGIFGLHHRLPSALLVLHSIILSTVTMYCDDFKRLLDRVLVLANPCQVLFIISYNGVRVSVFEIIVIFLCQIPIRIFVDIIKRRYPRFLQIYKVTYVLSVNVIQKTIYTQRLSSIEK